jgi:subfamily B ATP-binding cassette protein HlyB/CyaB
MANQIDTTSAEDSFDVNSLLTHQSLLGLLLKPNEIESLLKTYPPKTAKKDELIFQEGNPADDLIIVISGQIKLFARKTQVEVGVLTAGRSANLYSLIRNLPFQYSGESETNTEYIQIPWDVFNNIFKKNPVFERYLIYITEYPIVRFISKEMVDIGCSHDFRMMFLGSLQSVQLKSHSWIFQQGQVPNFAFMLVTGTIHNYYKSESSKVSTYAPVPGNTWIGWKEIILGKPISYSFRSTGTTRIMGVKSRMLKDVREKFPQDFATYSDWIEKAISSQKSPEDIQQEKEEVELTQTFMAAPKKKWWLKWSYPWVAQENQMDCGPACLAMISKFFQHEIPIQYWRNQIFTNREGTSVFDLAKGAEKNGFTTHGLYIEDLNDLEASMLPAIAVRQYHFIVIYKITPSHVTIGDPGVGIRKISREEFYKGYEFAILLVRPTENLKDIKIPPSNYAHFKQLFQGYNRELILVLTCSVLLVIFSLFPPILMQLVMDEVISRKDVDLLVFALSVVATVTVMQAGMSWLRSYYIGFINSKFDFRAQSSFLRKMFSLPYPFFANHHIGDFTRRLSEMERLREFLTGNVLSTILDLFTLVIYGAVLTIYSPLIALITFIVAPMLVGISMLFTKKLRSAYMEAFSSRAEEESLLSDLIRGVPAIKALTAEVAARWRLEEKIVNTLKARYKFTLTASALNSISDAYGTIARLFLMGTAAYLGIKGNLTPGQVVSISVFVNFVISPFQGLASTWSGIQELMSAMTRLNDIFLSPSEGKSLKGSLTKQRLRGEIEFRDVWFRYGGDSSDWVLKGVSFKIEPGQKVAIAGPSGSGKSTVANLLLRLFEPTQGQVLIDGHDYREYDLSWLRSQIGLILQDSHLFNGSVAENIAFGDPRAEEQKIIESAQMANAHDFISKKPAGYSYIISHGGFGLSGGEKQRISCARAFYMNPPVLILDEATSALDGVAEKELIQGILQASANRTVLSIAHRYTTARFFDHVLLMSGGKIVSFGSHARLREESELYSSLFGLEGKEDA